MLNGFESNTYKRITYSSPYTTNQTDSNQIRIEIWSVDRPRHVIDLFGFGEKGKFYAQYKYDLKLPQEIKSTKNNYKLHFVFIVKLRKGLLWFK